MFIRDRDNVMIMVNGEVKECPITLLFTIQRFSLYSGLTDCFPDTGIISNCWFRVLCLSFPSTAPFCRQLSSAALPRSEYICIFPWGCGSSFSMPAFFITSFLCGPFLLHPFFCRLFTAGLHHFYYYPWATFRGYKKRGKEKESEEVKRQFFTSPYPNFVHA